MVRASTSDAGCPVAGLRPRVALGGHAHPRRNALGSSRQSTTLAGVLGMGKRGGRVKYSNTAVLALRRIIKCSTPMPRMDLEVDESAVRFPERENELWRCDSSAVDLLRADPFRDPTVGLASVTLVYAK
jgi:hypothetical protein